MPQTHQPSGTQQPRDKSYQLLYSFPFFFLLRKVQSALFWSKSSLWTPDFFPSCSHMESASAPSWLPSCLPVSPLQFCCQSLHSHEWDVWQETSGAARIPQVRAVSYVREKPRFKACLLIYDRKYVLRAWQSKKETILDTHFQINLHSGQTTDKLLAQIKSCLLPLFFFFFKVLLSFHLLACFHTNICGCFHCTWQVH